MASEELKIDANNKVVAGAVTDDSNAFIKMLRIDDTTKGLKVSVVGGGGTGTVTSVSVTTANGVSGSVATATTTPAITLTLGAITPTTVNGITLSGTGSLANSGVSSLTAFTGSGSSSGTNTGDQTSVSGNAGTATILQNTRTIWGQNFNGSANVTGDITLSTANITMTGSIAATGARVTKGWFTDIESTNMPTVGGTSLSSTFAAIAGSTAQAFSASTIDLGNADTTLARVSAGVVSIEGVTVPTISSTSTITNKRNQPRITSAASYTTNTGSSLDISTTDIFVITAQAGALLFNNPGGTPVQGEKLIIRIKDNGTARALTWDTQFRAMGVALPSTTVLSKTLYLGFFYNSTDTKWDLVASAQEA